MASNDDSFSAKIDKNIGYEEESTQNNKDDGVNVKNDKRKTYYYETEEWKRIKEKRLTVFRNKQAEKKQKISIYDSMKVRE